VEGEEEIVSLAGILGLFLLFFVLLAGLTHVRLRSPVEEVPSGGVSW